MIILNIIGARPQFMKYLPISNAIGQRDPLIRDILVHTGQHYDYNMSKIFFDELGIKEPDHHLNVGSGTHGFQTAQIIQKIESILTNYKPDAVIIYGDTNSTLAGAIAASKMHIPVAHIEAGLRSYNKRMPEELNRILSDHVSTYLFCPSNRAVKNLESEGFSNIFENGRLASLKDVENPLTCDINYPIVVNSGDVMYDMILRSKEIALQKSIILKTLNISSKEYSVLTLHRAENTDDQVQFGKLIDFVNGTGTGQMIIFPLHPRTRKVYDTVGISFSSNVKIIEPVGYFDLICLLSQANMLLTDSGGMQKEAFWLGIPCITLREETEWTETIESGWNVLYKNYTSQFTPPEKKPSPYGHGNAADVIVRYLINSLR
jgi:UDP-GlcNAc3NAcA epimerase